MTANCRHNCKQTAGKLQPHCKQIESKLQARSTLQANCKLGSQHSKPLANSKRHTANKVYANCKRICKHSTCKATARKCKQTANILPGAHCKATVCKLHANCKKTHNVKLDFIIYAKLPTERDVSKLGKPQCKQQPQSA